MFVESGSIFFQLNQENLKKVQWNKKFIKTIENPQKTWYKNIQVV